MQNKIVLNSLHFPYTGGPQLYFKTFVNILDHEWIPKDNVLGWTASSEFYTYRLCEQRRLRRACASAQSRQNLRYSLIQAVSQGEPSDRKLDPWPLWMAGHAQLKFVLTECSKTQIRLTGPRVLSFRCSEKIFIFEVFEAYPEFGFFLKPGGSGYVSKDHIRWITRAFSFSLSVRLILIKSAIALLWPYEDHPYHVLHDIVQVFNGVLIFTDQIFGCKVFDIKLSRVFCFGYVQFNDWHCHLNHWK